MSKRKGLSIDEKKQRMLQLLYEKKEVFQLKDLEKIAPKEKGIITQSVKEVLQALVDDGFVDTDKIGTSVYFWAFPSKASNIRKRKIQELTCKLNESQKKIHLLNEQVCKAKVGKENSEDRIELLGELEKYEKQNHSLWQEIQKYSSCDPEVLDDVKKESILAKDAANRWTDNIFAVKSWCKNKFSCEETTLNKQFEIPEELDYVD